VVAGSTTGAFDDVFGVTTLQCDDRSTDRNRHVGANRTLARAQRARDEGRHATVALQLVDLLAVLATDLHVGHESRNRREGNPGFAEGRQHVFDVIQKERVGAHDQYTLTFQGRAVGEQQVRGPV